MLTVEKIGGTSMSKFPEVLENIIKGNRQKEDLYQRIFVVSAYSGVTNFLLEHKKTGEPGIYARFARDEDYRQALDELLDKLLRINRSFSAVGLDQDKAGAFITERINQSRYYLKSLAEVMASGYANKQNILLAAREILASIGEAHSAYNSANILENNGINATFVDLCGFNDTEYLTINQRIDKEFEHVDPSRCIPVVTGYTKGTEGIMREFDRGYSEVTFSKIAVKFKAGEAVIHKEFHLSTADPKIVGIDKSIPVGQTNFDVADQLADIGMEAIHPKASKPLEVAGISIRIKNTFEPEHPGTLITKTYRGKKAKVEIISGTDKVVAIEIHDPLMVGQVGFDLDIMKILVKYRISFILKATSANAITVVIDEEDCHDKLLADLEKEYVEVTAKKVAIVSALGTNIAMPGALSKATTALYENNINIEAVSQSLKQVNMQFIIDRKDYHRAIIAMNDALCMNGKKGS